MQQSSMVALAGATPLPESAQSWLWHQHGTPAVRRTLAGRPDLAPELQAQAVVDSDEAVVRAWLSCPRRSSDLLLAALERPLTDYSLACLASQQDLPATAVEALLDRAVEAVHSQLLLRTEITPEQRRRAARGLVAARVRSGWNDAQHLIDHLGTDAATWTAALEAAPRGSTAVPLGACLVAGSDTAVQQAAVHWWELHGIGRTNDAVGDTHRAIRVLLQNASLSPDLAARIADLAAEPQLSEQASRRSLTDVAAALQRSLSGTPDTATLTALAVVSLDGVRLPRGELLAAALLGGFDTTSQPVTVLVRTANTLELAEGVDLLVDASRSDLAVELVETGKSVVCLEHSRHAATLVPLLAARGFRDLLRSSLASQHAEEIARSFSPLADALWVTEVAGVALARIDRMREDNPAWAETALALLPSWQGTLPSLLSASVALAGQAKGT